MKRGLKGPLAWSLYCTLLTRDFSQFHLHGLSESTGNNVLLLFFRQELKRTA